MRSRLLIILLLATITTVYQSCDSSVNLDKPKDFYKYIGMDGDQTGVDLVTDVDGNAYILGTSKIDSLGKESYLGQQLYVVMTNAQGEVVWSQTYGGPGDDVPKDIEMLNDGTLIVLADRSDGDFVIYRLDKTRGTETKPAFVSGLEKLIGAASSDDHANTITQTTDGFIVAGYSDNGSYKTALIARYYADMTPYPISWNYQLKQQTSTSGYDVVPIKVVQKSANSFVVFGYTNTTLGGTASSYNYFVQPTGGFNDPLQAFMLIDADPVVQSNERLSSVQEVPVQSGGGYILTGYTSNPNSAVEDVFVARVVKDLSTASQQTFIQGTPRKITSGLVNLSGGSVSVCASTSSGFYILGSQGVLGDNNLYLTKLDNTLANAWNDPGPGRTLGGVGDDAAGAVAETIDGRVLVVGTMVLGDLKGQRKLVLMNLNSEGFFGN